MDLSTKILLIDLIPSLPATWGNAFLVMSAAVGTVLLVYAVFIEQEYRQDIIRMLGAGGLFVYALAIENVFFMIAMGAVALASAIEFVEIMMGLHKHNKEDLKRYKKMWRICKK